MKEWFTTVQTDYQYTFLMENGKLTPMTHWDHVPPSCCKKDSKQLCLPDNIYERSLPLSEFLMTVNVVGCYHTYWWWTEDSVASMRPLVIWCMLQLGVFCFLIRLVTASMSDAFLRAIKYKNGPLTRPGQAWLFVTSSMASSTTPSTTPGSTPGTTPSTSPGTTPGTTLTTPSTTLTTPGTTLTTPGTTLTTPGTTLTTPGTTQGTTLTTQGTTRTTPGTTQGTTLTTPGTTLTAPGTTLTTPGTTLTAPGTTLTTPGTTLTTPGTTLTAPGTTLTTPGTTPGL
nr:cell wall protein DAN4-like isoform X2 [Procambarus clarkii]